MIIMMLMIRLMNSSDAHNAFVCRTCGGLLSVYPEIRRQDVITDANGEYMGMYAECVSVCNYLTCVFFVRSRIEEAELCQVQVQ